MKNTLLLFTISLMVNSFDNINTIETSTFYIINSEGAKVYDQPSFLSNIIDTLKVGDKLISNKVSTKKDSIKIGDELFLHGNFHQISIDNRKAFVFSSDFSSIKPKLRKITERYTAIDISGEKINHRTEIRDEKIDGNNYKIKYEITEYENCTYIEYSIEGCYEYEYKYKNFSLAEVYYEMINLTFSPLGDGLLGNPKYIKKDDEKLSLKCFDPSTPEDSRIVKSKNIEALLFKCIPPSGPEDVRIVKNKDGSYSIKYGQC